MYIAKRKPQINHKESNTGYKEVNPNSPVKKITVPEFQIFGKYGTHNITKMMIRTQSNHVFQSLIIILFLQVKSTINLIHKRAQTLEPRYPIVSKPQPISNLQIAQIHKAKGNGEVEKTIRKKVKTKVLSIHAISLSKGHYKSKTRLPKTKRQPIHYYTQNKLSIPIKGQKKILSKEVNLTKA